MQAIALCYLGIWFYSIGSLVYIPFKIAGMKRKSQDVWTFLSRRRLLLSALAYLASAPFLGVVAMAIAAGGVSGSNASGVPGVVETIAWGICFVFLAAAVIALLFVFIRPRPDAA